MNDASSKPADEYSLINRFAEFFDDKGWCYHRQTDRPAIDLAFTGEAARWQCVALGDPKGQHMVFISLLCLVPPNRRPQVAELFSRINRVITHGCFELDRHNGEVRFRTSQSLSSPDVSLDCIGDLYPERMRLPCSGAPTCCRLWALPKAPHERPKCHRNRQTGTHDPGGDR